MIPQYLTFVLAMLCAGAGASRGDRRIITTLKYSKNTIVPTVIRGKPAALGDLPYLVSIKDLLLQSQGNRSVWSNICGGSIFAPSKVLTAAHCFESNDFHYLKNPQLLRVIAGNLATDLMLRDKDLTSTKTRDGQMRRISKVRIHALFLFPSNDIAVVYVNEPWVFNQYVQPVLLARLTTDYPRKCATAGYGRMGTRATDAIAPKLLKGDVYVLPRWKCAEVWEMNMHKYVCSNTILSDVDSGDSGGPLVCRGTIDPAEVPGRDLQVGVISGKNVDKTTLYTRVSEYKGWIQRARAQRTLDSLLHFVTVFVVHVFAY